VRHWNPRANPRIPVRLACVRRAASVRSEPGSNSQLEPPSPRDAPRQTGIPIRRRHRRARSGPRHHFAKVAPKTKAPARDLSIPGPARPRGLLKGDKSEPGATSPRRPQAPQRDPKATAPKQPPDSPRHQRCLSPTTPSRPPPTHPFLSPHHLVKEHTGASGYA
jgi:hypothetical protein